MLFYRYRFKPEGRRGISLKAKLVVTLDDKYKYNGKYNECRSMAFVLDGG